MSEKVNVNTLLNKCIGKQLKSSGFRKKGLSFIREVSQDVWHLIEVQKSRGHEGWVTLNCGIYVSGTTSVYRNATEPKQPKLTDCCIVGRIGMLKEPYTDIWWELDNLQADGEICSAVSDVILPFLDNHRKLVDIIDFLTNRPEVFQYVDPRATYVSWCYAALAQLYSGNIEEGWSLLNRAVDASAHSPVYDLMKNLRNRLKRNV